MTAIAHGPSVAETVVVRRRPAAPSGPRRTLPPAPPASGRTSGRSVAPEGARPAVRPVAARAVPPRSARPAAAAPAVPAPAGWGYPPPSAYPQAPLPTWAALAPAGLAAPSGPLTGPIFVTGPTRLDALLRRWLP
jgi:hypothetical protein